MPLYNFTVRAEDNSGAFADRDFAINVRNTVTDKFVIATGTGGAYSSVDGVTWNPRPSPLGQEIAYGGGKWLSYGNGAAGIQPYWISSDAINWSQYNTPATVDASQGGQPLAYGNGMWMMMTGVDAGNSRYNFTSYVSNDGVTWTQMGSLPAGTAIAYGRLAYGGGRWMLTRFGSGTLTTGAWTSTNNGATWTPVTFPTSVNTTDAIYVNGMWLVTDAFGSGAIWTSIDAVNWMKRSMPGGTSLYYPINIAYGNGIFFAAAKTSSGPNGGWVSTDTVTWTSVSGLPSATVDINTGGCAFAGGRFVTTRNTASPAWSRDGVTWTAITTLPAGTRYSVAGVSVG